MKVGEILHPIALEDFKSTFWKRKFCYAPGDLPRYTDIFDWDALNNLLQTQRLLPPRLRLVHKGRHIAPYDFQLREPAFLIDSERLHEELRRGATLVIDDVDEVHLPLKEIAISLVREFQAPVNISAYAGWKRDHGFDPHYDVQENFILQITGRKHWRIWEPTCSNPLKSKIITNEEPQSGVIWDGILEPGSFLYIPPGWWHVATPMNEPCLHLTVSITPYRGIDLVSWLADRLKETLHVKSYLPEFDSTEETGQYLQSLVREIEKGLSVESYRAFVEEMGRNRIIYPRINFPEI